MENKRYFDLIRATKNPFLMPSMPAAYYCTDKRVKHRIAMYSSYMKGCEMFADYIMKANNKGVIKHTSDFIPCCYWLNDIEGTESLKPLDTDCKPFFFRKDRNEFVKKSMGIISELGGAELVTQNMIEAAWDMLATNPKNYL